MCGTTCRAQRGRSAPAGGWGVGGVEGIAMPSNGAVDARIRAGSGRIRGWMTTDQGVMGADSMADGSKRPGAARLMAFWRLGVVG